VKNSEGKKNNKINGNERKTTANKLLFGIFMTKNGKALYVLGKILKQRKNYILGQNIKKMKSYHDAFLQK
jgi:hypothetical protein